ncbi:MAG: class I SAM-dependent methyltransferase [Candidatus ainarchaeum sp.]|nr:class I SAM-dependent methyltransferase [Candidatus ainarchaeum sp.]
MMARTIANPLAQPTGTLRERFKIKFRVLAEGLRKAYNSKPATPLRYINPFHGMMEVDKLRRGGFAKVWGEAGDLLAKDNGNLDRYLLESGTYSTVATLLTRLRHMDRVIATAKKILDVTAMTGGVAKHMLENGSGDARVYANEISARMIKKRDATLAEYIDGTRCVPISIDLSKPKLVEDSLTVREFDIILWWGSFQIAAGRKMAIDNAFDLLKEGGHFIIIDVYPFNMGDLGKRLGEDKAKRLAYISKPFDMGYDLKRLVTKQWGYKVIQERLTRHLNSPTEPGQPRQIDIVEDAERFGPGAYTQMRCLCFTKPRIGKTERMPVLEREQRPELQAVNA